MKSSFVPASFDVCRTDVDGSTHCYSLVQRNMTAFEAQTACSSHMHLASVDTSDENIFISAMSRDCKNHSLSMIAPVHLLAL